MNAAKRKPPEQHSDGRHPDEELKPGASSGKVIAGSRGAEAAARRTSDVDVDDGMIVEDSDPETERLRDELSERVARRVDATRDALDKWQAILRRRHAEGTIAKGLSKEGIVDRFKERWSEYLTEKIFEFGRGIIEAAEIGLGPADAVVGRAKGLVDDHVAAQQAAAEVSAIDSIVFSAGAAAKQVAHGAKVQIKVMFHADVRKLVETPEMPVDQHAIIGHLDALLLEAMRASGTQNVNEQLDALGQRGRLDDDIDAVERIAKRHGGGDE